MFVNYWHNDETTRQMLMALGCEWVVFTTYWYNDESDIDTIYFYDKDKNEYFDIYQLASDGLPPGEWFLIEDSFDNVAGKKEVKPISFTTLAQFEDAIRSFIWHVDEHFDENGRVEIHLPSSTVRQVATALMSEPELYTYEVQEPENDYIDFRFTERDANVLAIANDEYKKNLASCSWMQPDEQVSQTEQTVVDSFWDVNTIEEFAGYGYTLDAESKQMRCGERVVADFSDMNSFAIKLHQPHREALLKDLQLRLTKATQFLETSSGLWATVQIAEDIAAIIDAKEVTARLWDIDKVDHIVVTQVSEYNDEGGYYNVIDDIKAYDANDGELVRTYPGFPDELAEFNADFDEETFSNRQDELDSHMRDLFYECLWNLSMPRNVDMEGYRIDMREENWLEQLDIYRILKGDLSGEK